MVSNNFAPIQKKRKKKNHEDTLRGNYEHVLFHWFRLEEPRAIVLFNHIRIELLNRDLIICSNFDLTEKKNLEVVFAKKERQRRKRSFRNASLLLERYSSGGAQFVWNELYLPGGPISFWIKKIVPSLLCATFLNEKRKKENVRSGKV